MLGVQRENWHDPMHQSLESLHNLSQEGKASFRVGLGF